jgi:hypothetical protein
METTHEALHLDKWSLVQWKIMDTPKRFIWFIIFFDGTFEYSNNKNYEVMKDKCYTTLCRIL